MQNSIKIPQIEEFSDEKLEKPKTKHSLKNQINTNSKTTNNKRKILFISISIILALVIVFLLVYLFVIKKRKKTNIEQKKFENNNYITAKYSFKKEKETTLFNPEIVNIDKSQYEIEIIPFNDSDQKRGLLQHKNNYLFTPSSNGNALVKIKFNTILTNIDFLFQYCDDLLYIDFSNFNSSEITSMSSTFLGDTNLQKVNFTSFNSSKVKTMDFLFAGCEKLIEVNTEFLNTKNIVSMSGMFIGCKSLRTVNLTNFDMSNIEDVGGMFADCPSLKAVDLTSFKDINYMFDDLKNNDEVIIKVDKNKINETFINEKYNNKIKMVENDLLGALEVGCEIGEGDKCKTCEIGYRYYCKECNKGYYLSTNETTSKMKCNKCNEDNEGCSECSINDNILKCTNCEENYKLFEGNCIKNCEIGENDSCASCNFADGKNAECLKCNNGYYLDYKYKK